MTQRVPHCWTARYEAMGYDGYGDAIVALGPDGMDELWTSSGREPGAWRAAEDPFTLADPLNDICLLLDGHEGEHEYTATENIVVEFAPAEVTP